MVFKHGVYSAGWVLITVLPFSMLFLDDWVADSDVIVGAITAFGMAAIPEEFKHQVLRKRVAPHKDFGEPMDGVVYGAVASLGLPIENLLTVHQEIWGRHWGERSLRFQPMRFRCDHGIYLCP